MIMSAFPIRGGVKGREALSSLLPHVKKWKKKRAAIAGYPRRSLIWGRVNGVDAECPVHKPEYLDESARCVRDDRRAQSAAE